MGEGKGIRANHLDPSARGGRLRERGDANFAHGARGKGEGGGARGHGNLHSQKKRTTGKKKEGGEENIIYFPWQRAKKKRGPPMAAKFAHEKKGNQNEAHGRSPPDERTYGPRCLASWGGGGGTESRPDHNPRTQGPSYFSGTATEPMARAYRKGHPKVDRRRKKKKEEKKEGHLAPCPPPRGRKKTRRWCRKRRKKKRKGKQPESGPGGGGTQGKTPPPGWTQKKKVKNLWEKEKGKKDPTGVTPLKKSTPPPQKKKPHPAPAEPEGERRSGPKAQKPRQRKKEGRVHGAQKKERIPTQGEAP